MRMLAIRLTLTALSVSLPSPAFASDGVLEINQVCATSAAGCFAGDSASYPVTISQPGSYRLTGNLSLPSNTTAINILANGVTLDLGGFSISGPNVCTGLPVNDCTTNFGSPGIQAIQPGQYGVTVRNGSIVGMGGAGVHMLDDTGQTIYAMVAEDLVVVGNGGGGISLGGLSRVARCQVHRNLQSGISVQVQSFAADNDIYANGGNGLNLGNGSQAMRNRIRFNHVRGIGIGGSGFLLRENSMNSNQGGDGLPSGGLSTNDNICGSALC